MILRACTTVVHLLVPCARSFEFIEMNTSYIFVYFVIIVSRSMTIRTHQMLINVLIISAYCNISGDYDQDIDKKVNWYAWLCETNSKSWLHS